MKNSKKNWLPIALFLGAGAVLALSSCKSSEFQKLTVKNLDSEKYLGEWYEIARFDFKYEKDLKNVTANYSKRDDGKIKVVNKGFNYIKKEWEEKEGKAKFAISEDVGALKVSFFGPFYAEYNVVMLEPNYQSVLIFGDSTKYIWILSRQKTLSKELKEKYVAYAKSKGYPVENLVWTEQD